MSFSRQIFENVMRHVAIVMTATTPVAGRDALVGLLSAGSLRNACPDVNVLFREVVDWPAEADGACSS